MNTSDLCIKHGLEFPYHGKPPKDWAETAACGIISELEDRCGIGDELLLVRARHIRSEIIEKLADIIRVAKRRYDISLVKEA